MEKQIFEGQMTNCNNAAPHAPHVTGTYETVAHGTLQIFCSGVEHPHTVLFEGDAECPASIEF